MSQHIKRWQDRAKEIEPDPTKWHFRMTKVLRDAEITELRAALAAQQQQAAPAIPEGYRLVPDISTGKMDDAGLASLGRSHFSDSGGIEFDTGDIESIYVSMPAAAPLPPVPKGGK